MSVYLQDWDFQKSDKKNAEAISIIAIFCSCDSWEYLPHTQKVRYIRIRNLKTLKVENLVGLQVFNASSEQSRE